jgi:hypothetical protein
MRAIIGVLSMLLLFGCGGGGGSSSGGGAGYDPYLQVTFSTAEVCRGGTVDVTYAWNSSQDISEVYSQERWGNYEWNYRYPASRFGINGRQGSVPGRLTIKPVVGLGTHTIVLWLRDALGRESNRTSQTLTIKACSGNYKELDGYDPILDR